MMSMDMKKMEKNEMSRTKLRQFFKRPQLYFEACCEFTGQGICLRQKQLILQQQMKSDSNRDAGVDKQELSQFNKSQPVELTLTHDQFTMIQHFLPKGLSLLEKKSGKRDKAASHKFADNENLSRFSGGFDNTEEDGGRSKRNRTKKTDRFLEQETPRVSKRTTSDKFHQKFTLDDDIHHCAKILNQLKKHKNVYPFMEPVDPKKSGASNYLDVIKQPMDLSKIQRNLKSGEYQTATQFHADVAKIWHNSYSYNDKASDIYKMTVQLQKFYKKLLEEGGRKKNSKQKSKSKKINQDFSEANKFDQGRQSNPKSQYQNELSNNNQNSNQEDDES